MKKAAFLSLALLLSATAAPVIAISEAQQKSIEQNCANIKVELKKIQKSDARARVYLGAYYETILNKFIIPLNVRLIENGLSTAEFVENQNKFTSIRATFSNDFIKYQQSLEELVAMDCKSDPDRFYDKLVVVRERRKIMDQDVLRMRSLLSEHVKLIDKLKGKL